MVKRGKGVVASLCQFRVVGPGRVRLRRMGVLPQRCRDCRSRSSSCCRPGFGKWRRNPPDACGQRAVVAGGWLLSHADNGFRRGAVRLRCAQDLYTTYIPFAVAGGSPTSGRPSTKRPRVTFRRSRTGTGDVAWHKLGRNLFWGASFDSFESALSSSISAYTASQSSSSSSSGRQLEQRRWWRRRWWVGEEAVHGEFPAGADAGDRGGGAARNSYWATTRFVALTCGCGRGAGRYRRSADSQGVAHPGLVNTVQTFAAHESDPRSCRRRADGAGGRDIGEVGGAA